MPTDSESATLLARARLATLTAHLLPYSNNEPTDHLLPHRLSAQSPAANLYGTLTVVDERTGKKYQVEVSRDGTVKATDFKKVWLSYVSS
ncbi:citrate synthase glyoxysomal-like [Trifolium medium]|uniref:Citrate synthase glyoxysomal-like n=1 Tax=Trifolium medium TaxID=97028 RepID=A0A392PHW7_9FABA|nr:citrate synthase glyoxysomal-like [Trifolium medium]